MEFTYEAYKRLITNIVNSGYQITDYHDYKKVERPCILRHDVDMSLEKAVGFAELEHDITREGIGSTYFVLISSDFYNVYSRENIRLLKRICSLGHEIGLHFDEKKYMDEDAFDARRIIENVLREIKLFSEMLERPVDVVSMHRPSKRFIESDINFPGIINSYSKEFFNEFKYLSDSRMHWRENVEEAVVGRDNRALHILTHPFWYAEQNGTLEKKIVEFIKQASKSYYLTLNDNIKDLGSVVNLEDI